MSCCVISKKSVQSMYTHNHNDIIIQLSPDGEVNSAGYTETRGVEVHISHCSPTLRRYLFLFLPNQLDKNDKCNYL